MMNIKWKYREENRFAENWEELTFPSKRNAYTENIK